MTDQILSTIIQSSYTTHDLRKKVRILKAFISKKLFGADTTDLDLEIRTEINWIYQLGDSFFAQFNQSNFSPIFQEIETKIDHLNPLIIYFAFEPNEAEINGVGSWLRKNYGPEFIFDHKLDPTLIAGCALVWKGVYRDYSLRSKIEENRQGIIEVVRGSINATK